MKQWLNKLLMTVLAATFCLSAVSPLILAAETGPVRVETSFETQYGEEPAKWTFEYDDSWFRQSAAIYNHDLAQASFGVAVSGYSSEPSVVKGSDLFRNLQQFYTACGFEDLRSDKYERNPALSSVPSVIGHKSLQDEQGEYVLLAVGICGGSFEDEWLSEFTVDDGEILEGFRAAAQEMYDRLFGYITMEQLSGRRYKVWLAGYGRAGGVANLLAGMLSDSEVFNSDTVYAYTFGAPRTVKNPPKDKYPNIYNICGKLDPFAQIAFADWGYDRYGTTLYTPSQQTDSDYNIKVRKAATVHQQVFGTEFRNDVEEDTKLRIIMNYLLKLVPSERVYSQRMQETVLKIWEDRSFTNIMSRLMELAGDSELINEANEAQANSLLTYLAFMIYGYLTNSGVSEPYRRDRSGDLVDFFHEHVPEAYFAWLFSSDDPAQIYSDAGNYLRLVINGDVDVAVMVLGNYELYKCLKSDGTFSDEFLWEGRVIRRTDPDAPDIFMERVNGQHIMILPKDQPYSIMIKSNRDQKVEVHAIQLSIDRTNSDFSKLHSSEMKMNTYEVFLSVENSDIETDGDSDFMAGNTFDIVDRKNGSFSDLAFDLEKVNFLNLSWRALVILAFVIPVAVVILLLFFICRGAAKHNFSLKQKQGEIKDSERYDARPMGAMFGAVLLFLLQELLFWLMPKYMLQRAAIKLIIGLILLYLCYVGYRKRPTSLSRNLLISLALCMLGDIVINFNFS
ncbi:MAG: hypothetical protein II161_02340, partial [Erysipelotrichaceae bacterium]|nr:hypothetical protein [Erysipelotrichaceae bacterium]